MSPKLGEIFKPKKRGGSKKKTIENVFLSGPCCLCYVCVCDFFFRFSGQKRFPVQIKIDFVARFLFRKISMFFGFLAKKSLFFGFQFLEMAQKQPKMVINGPETLKRVNGGEKEAFRDHVHLHKHKNTQNPLRALPGTHLLHTYIG